MDKNSTMLDTGEFAEEMAEWPVGETYAIKVEKTDSGFKVVETSPDAAEPSEPAEPAGEAVPMKHKNPAIANLMSESKA